MIKYLSGCTGSYLEDGIAHANEIGLLVQPRNSYHSRAGLFPFWAGDNGAFSVASEFDPVRFRTMLKRPGLQNNKDTCLFVAAPDWLVVFSDGDALGNAAKTLEQFPAWAEEIRAAGFPVALVAQNGLEYLLDEVPWELVDVLFLGGSTEWKTGVFARLCVCEAQRRGKKTHMGRVNGYRRLALANSWGIDTADGTFLGFGPTQNLPRLLRWFEKLKESNESIPSGRD